MPRKASTKHIAVYMGDEAIDAIKTIAAWKGYKSVGEYIRSLIEQDIKAMNYPIDFGIDGWGGPGRQVQTGKNTDKKD